MSLVMNWFPEKPLWTLRSSWVSLKWVSLPQPLVPKLFMWINICLLEQGLQCADFSHPKLIFNHRTKELLSFLAEWIFHYLYNYKRTLLVIKQPGLLEWVTFCFTIIQLQLERVFWQKFGLKLVWFFCDWRQFQWIRIFTCRTEK